MRVEELMVTLNGYIEKSEDWMFKKDSLSIQTAQQTYDIFESLYQLLTEQQH